MPHAGAFQRNERDAFAAAHRLHLRAAVALGTEHRAFQIRRLGRIDVQRNLVLARRQDAARVQDPGAAGGDFLGLVVVQRAQKARGGRGARVGAEHARHVGPDLQPLGPQLGREVGRRGIRAAAPQQHRVAVLIAGNESLGDDDRREPPQPLLERRIGRETAHRREHARLGRGAVPLFGTQHGARIRPGRLESARAQEAHADVRGHQLTGG